MRRVIAVSVMGLTLLSHSGLAAGELDDGARKFSSLISTTFASDYLTKPGFVPGRGPVNQTLLYSDYAIGPHRSVSGLLWTDYDFTDDVFHEIDLGVYFNTHTAIHAGFLGGRIGARIGYEIFVYPSKLLGEDPDHIFRSGLHFSGPLELDAEFTQLLTSGGGQMVALTASKSIAVFRRRNFVLAASPSLKATVVNDFFGFDGLTKISPGLSVDISFLNWSYYFGVEIQNGRHGMADITQYSGGVRMRF